MRPNELVERSLVDALSPPLAGAGWKARARGWWSTAVDGGWTGVAALTVLTRGLAPGRGEAVVHVGPGTTGSNGVSPRRIAGDPSELLRCTGERRHQTTVDAARHVAATEYVLGAEAARLAADEILEALAGRDDGAAAETRAVVASLAAAW